MTLPRPALPVRLAAALLLALPVLAVPAPAGAQTAPTVTAPTPGQSTYVAREPVRLLDTREGTGRVGPDATVDVQLDVPAAVRAVVLNVTGLGASLPTAVTAYPAGAARPAVAQLPVAPGAIAADLVVVPVGEGGRVRLHNAAGLVHLLADVTGWYAEQEGPGYVAGTSPQRLLDTRSTGGALRAGEVRQLQVTGGAVPAGATAAVLNVTALGATARQTDVRVYPTRSAAAPTVSLTNPGVGRPTNAVAIATLGTGGRVSLRNGAGTVHLVVDLQGWYVPGAGAVFHPVPPVRVAALALTGGQPQDVVVAGPGTVPAQASAVALNVTVSRTSPSSDVRVYPSQPAGSPPPDASNLYAVRDAPPVANAVVARVGRDGGVAVRTTAGTAEVTVDLVGWWGPRGTGWDVSWPQCRTEGSAQTVPLPESGAFAVVGVNRGTPFTEVECATGLRDWARSLPGENAVYVNIDAPGSAHPMWTVTGPRPCSGATTDAGCAYNYGRAAALYSAERTPPTASGSRPFVWIDVENGDLWQTGTGAVAVNRAALDGMAQGLREAGHRYGVYTDAEPRPRNDWVQIMGERTLPDLPLWVFASTNTGSRELCVPAARSITRGPVQMVQLRPDQTGQRFDVDDLC